MMKVFKPLLFIVIVFSVVSLACGTSGNSSSDSPSGDVDNPEVEQPVVEPTEEVIVEQVPQVEQPTEEVIEEVEADSSPAFFTEDFNGDLDDWSYFLMSGDENKMDLYTEDSSLVFDLEGTYQYVYVMYDPFTYSKVGIEVSAENRGMNTNNVSLICNYTDKYGWYEFSVTNGGLYFILVYSELDGGYDTLAEGGSTNVVTGRHENVYSATCEGNKLALYINGILEYEFTDNVYNLTEGQVGFGVASFEALPIIVYTDYVSIFEY
jgi:hypothetical protein